MNRQTYREGVEPRKTTKSFQRDITLLNDEDSLIVLT